MTRTDQDSWDLASSVGATATMVAAARALATAGSNPIINDPFAAPLVRAVGLDFFRRLVDGDIVPSDAYDGGEKHLALETDSIAVRTRFFDDFFLNAARDGIRQSVILAAGLDARAYRLAWPPGSVVYEVDQPRVVEFKSTAMSDLGAVPTADRRAVSIDLRDDWPAALRRNGFNVTQPTAWSAEGLLMYLPPDAQDRLFEMYTALSAPGSRVAVEAFGINSNGNTQRWRRMRERLGLDVNVEALTYHEPDRSDAAQWLVDHGWQVHGVNNRDEMARLGRPVPEDLADEAVRSTLLRARLGGPSS